MFSDKVRVSSNKGRIRPLLEDRVTLFVSNRFGWFSDTDEMGTAPDDE